MNEGPVYLDYAATTPVDPRVAARMAEWLGGGKFGNAASVHVYGAAASAAVEQARAQVAALIGAPAREIVWTSGATESNNLAILGVARGHASAPRAGGTAQAAAGGAAVRRHVISSRTEHKSVLDPCAQLEREGFKLTYLEPDSAGIITATALREALRNDTLLVSIMHVNNETGVVQDIAALGALCREHGVKFHVDAAQSVGKLAINLADLPVDLLSTTAHKLYGPQGIGALYVRTEHRASMKALILGGGHERGLRSGTLPVHQIVGFGAACELATQLLDAENLRVRALRQKLYQGLADLPDVILNSHPLQNVPGILNLSFPGVQGESLVAGLKELALSTSAACHSDSDEPSYVLRSLGRDAEAAQAALRFSIGRTTTESDIDVAIAAVRREVTRLRALAPARGATGTEVPDGGAGVPGTRVVFTLGIQAGRVAGASHRSYGCPYTLAVADWLAAQLPGRSAADPGLGGPLDWAKALSVPPDRLGHLLVVEDALNLALTRP